MKTIVSLFFTCIILVGCNQKPAVDISKDIEALRLIEDQWVEAERAGDVDKILSYFAPSSVDMSNNVPVSYDQEEKRKALEAWLAAVDPKSIKNTTDDIQVSSAGDLAFTRGRGYQKSRDGLVEFSNRWVTIYRKIDGNWKVILNIDHPDNPVTIKTN